MLCNVYSPVGDFFIEHWYTAKAGEADATPSGKIECSIYLPSIIKYYRQYTGGVDLFDQFRSYYKLELRSVKYWHPMFWSLKESTLVNAWVVYCDKMKARGLETAYTPRKFRLVIAKLLAGEWWAMHGLYIHGRFQCWGIANQSLQIPQTDGSGLICASKAMTLHPICICGWSCRWVLQDPFKKVALQDSLEGQCTGGIRYGQVTECWCADTVLMSFKWNTQKEHLGGPKSAKSHCAKAPASRSGIALPSLLLRP